MTAVLTSLSGRGRITDTTVTGHAKFIICHFILTVSKWQFMFITEVIFRVVVGMDALF